MGRSIIFTRHIDIHITHAGPGRLILEGLVLTGIGRAGAAAFRKGDENYDRVFRKSRGVLTVSPDFL